MIVVEDLNDPALDAAVGTTNGRVHVAVGTFDGVHRAHQLLLGRVAGEAHAHGGLAAVLTFRNHPRSVVSPGGAPPLLTPWPMKRRLLGELPLDLVVGLAFDEAFARIPAESFVRDILLGRLRAATIHSGENFRFGRGALGSPSLLRAMAGEGGYAYHALDPLLVTARPISSTRIREALAHGAVGDAAELLGRPHRIEASVQPGDQLGRTIGFPTANLAVPRDVLLPADGVYAVRAGIDVDPTLPAMMNIGWRPTVAGRDHRVEVHVIGTDTGPLDGRTLSIDFIARLRDEQRFATLDALKAQLAHDREAALAALA